jgi:hypothetical protein
VALNGLIRDAEHRGDLRHATDLDDGEQDANLRGVQAECSGVSTAVL